MNCELIWLVLLPASIFDLSRYRIPNSIPVAGLCISLFRHLESYGLVGIETWLAGVIIPGILYYLFFRLHFFGASDGKIMSVVGSYVGIPGIFSVIFYSLIVGALMGIIKLVYIGDLQYSFYRISAYISDTVQSKKIKPYYYYKSRGNIATIPYGVAIAFGTLIYLAG